MKHKPNKGLKSGINNGFGMKAPNKASTKIFKMKMYIIDNGGYVDDHTPWKEVRKIYKKMKGK